MFRFLLGDVDCDWVMGAIERNSNRFEREFKIERSGQWDKGKGSDTFVPIGPYIVTQDEISDVQNLKLKLRRVTRI